MKSIFKQILCCCVVALCTASITGCSDSDEGKSGNTGFWDVVNPSEGAEISRYGETITISFTTNAGWSLEEPSVGWVRVLKKTGDAEGGKCSLQLSIDPNNGKESRSTEIFVTVMGHSRSRLCTLTQASSSGSKIDQFLNEKMDERLRNEYLWNTAYKALADKNQINFQTSYQNFLYENLTKLGETNIEDGGYYRDYSVNRGKRYIYSMIEEIGNSSVHSSAAQTRAPVITGLGMGPTLSAKYVYDNSTCLTLGYVYLDSPAAEAGLRRGDMIFSVNGNKLTHENYYRYQVELYTTTSGTYKLEFGRFDDKDGVTLVEYETTVTAKNFNYNPIILAAQIATSDGLVNIGYLVLDSFDITTHEILEHQLNDFAEKGIKDLILDLRFNPGGAVAECRYLMSSIVGKAHYDDIFAKMTFVDGREENWSFGYGSPTESDGLGQGPDLGLNRLYVICSENTASASEIVINSLKGIDFEVNTYGSRTEGKNVGMVTSQIVYDGRRFEYSPITFYVKNAKGFGDYADGFEVDHSVNNQNSNWNDDLDQMYPYGTADWGNLKGDWSLIWAVENATTGKDPDFGDNNPAAQKFMMRSNNLQMLPNAPIKLERGRFGNVIYGSQVDEN